MRKKRRAVAFTRGGTLLSIIDHELRKE